MKLVELKEWLPFLETAPEGIREYLTGTFWMLVFLLLIWAILKVLTNKEFKQLYSIASSGAQMFGSISKKAAKGVAESLELPEPYPRLTKFFSTLFMLSNYAAFFLFLSFFLAFTILLVMSDISSFWQRTGGMLFSVILGYFSWFFFAQAERDRVRIFKNNGEQDS
ncbi:hypothetical protein [Vibrio cholerae]|uniref:hypothetical protein n=1 Tax=Vibrio cholerae TaxID=666 RepID=UPI00115BBC5C|nr:hypothetical protein [Vibrio cholerae]TQP21731.1 hypothetical protein FLM04_11115 [Vibrio cholerae]TQP71705.1 hypothetical protein FLL75_16185 [Vibrio cholerae]GIA35525.1 hypothetical protein VCSRO85_3398 [Vibrio cholerae]